MLRATHEVLKPGAPNVFYVIAVTEGLTDDQLARIATRDGNEYVGAESGYDEMMRQAGFGDVEQTELTADYLDTLVAWKCHWEADSPAFIELIGEEDYAIRMGRRSSDIRNVEDGLLKRYLVSGVKM